ncbi:MAG: amino acid ABC transporter ATP-binding protein [Coriobacteriales bacterium]|nr:amino acid ABC transporter ATP-binding protein [Coriobacteriales bacterium]
MTNPTVPAVSVQHARKAFGDNVVLDDVSLNIMPGEVLSMIGPSGAGKSTMLRCMTLLDRFDSADFSYGDLVVCQRGEGGHSTYDPKAEHAARMRFGIVFQHYNLFPHYTVLQNITDAPIVVQKRNREEVESEAHELLRQLDLTQHANKVPCELSGGQQQRVAIARALAMNPNVIYFDEATSALDPKLTADMQRLIRDLASNGMAVGIVTHEMGFAKLVSDRIAFLFDGEIAEEGAAEQVIDNPQDPRTKRFLSQAED